MRTWDLISSAKRSHQGETQFDFYFKKITLATIWKVGHGRQEWKQGGRPVRRPLQKSRWEMMAHL